VWMRVLKMEEETVRNNRRRQVDGGEKGRER
jgi:hypothetical protein